MHDALAIAQVFPEHKFHIKESRRMFQRMTSYANGSS
jgi:hypothetical protein